MVKTITPQMQEHLSQEVTTLATLWLLRRLDGQTFHFTDHDKDIVFDGEVYSSDRGYNRSAIQNNSGMSVDNLDIMGVFDLDLITEEEIRAGLFDYCEIYIMVVNWAHPEQGAIKMRRGRLGEVVLTSNGWFQSEMRGMTQNLSQNIGQIYQPECRADLGDSRCKVPIRPPLIEREGTYSVGETVRVSSDPDTEVFHDRIFKCTGAGTTAAVQPVYDFNVSATTIDGTASFTAEESWTRQGEVTAVTDRNAFAVNVSDSRATDGWFAGGAVIFESGDNQGWACEVRVYEAATGLVVTFLDPPFAVQVGDKISIYPGCDKRLEVCRARFDNVINFRGEPHIPGVDEVTYYPDAN